MAPFINTRKIRQLCESSLGVAGTATQLGEALDLGLAGEPGGISPHEISLSELFEAVVDNGSDIIRSWSHGQNPEVLLMEAGGHGAVSTAAYSHLAGRLLSTAAMEGFQVPNLIGESLVTNFPTNKRGERMGGISESGDKDEEVGEGDAYPEAAVSDDWIDTPIPKKQGHIVSITKEALVHDDTNLVLERCRNRGIWAAINKEKEIIDLATGQSNNWKWRDTAYNTYYASGGHGWVNQHVAVLTNYTDIDEAELLFDAMLDPATQEPLTRVPTTLLVPTALKKVAQSILHATGARRDDRAASANQFGFDFANPLNGAGYEIATNQYVKSRTSSAVKWFFGDFKKAFKYMEVWPFQTSEEGSNSMLSFQNDIVARFKISQYGIAAVTDPSYVTYSVGSG